MTELRLLWEPGDAQHALVQRFGFHSPAAAESWLRTALQAHWNIRLEHCEQIVISASNALAWIQTPTDRLIAKWSAAPESFERLSELAVLTSWLDRQNVPVSAPIAGRDGRGQQEFDGISMGLQHEIAGGLLDVADHRAVYAAGAELARLHDALARYPDVARMAPPRPRPPLPTRITSWLRSDADRLPAATREALCRLLTGAPSDPLPAPQLVHRDFRAANVLCAGAEVLAIIDFEQAGHDHRILDLAHAAVMLGTRFRDWGPVSAEVKKQFLAGYQSVQSLTATEAAWWPILVYWESLVMAPEGEDPAGWEAAGRLWPAGA